MACKHSIPTDGDITCSILVHTGKISLGVCAHCDKNTDVEWQRNELSKTPVAITISAPIKPKPPVSDIGDKLQAILAGYGVTKTTGCNCNGIKNLLNSKTREQVLEKIEQLALGLVDNLKRNPNVADNAPVWVRMAVKAMRFDPMDIAAKAMAEKLLRQACE